jgi:hypothetical protein
LDDDGSGWNAVLLEVWSVAVRDAVVRRIEAEAPKLEHATT